MLDLKHLLIEAKQRVPEFLLTLEAENEPYLNIGGRFGYNSLLEIHIYFWTLFECYTLFSFSVFVCLPELFLITAINLYYE